VSLLKTLLNKSFWFTFLLGTVWLAFQGENSSASEAKYLDFRAFILVFLSPIGVMFLFMGKRIRPNSLLKRILGLLKTRTSDLQLQFVKKGNSEGIADVLRKGEFVQDSFFLYASDVLTCGHSKEDALELLKQRIYSEDRFWEDHASVFNYLAKLAPYFGMLATVIGMIDLLGSVDDPSKLNIAMGMALSGTMYGLISYLFIFGPIHKVLSLLREDVFQRNSMILRWIELKWKLKTQDFILEDIYQYGSNEVVNKAEELLN
jgi:flagellar motor component MotA